MALRVEPVGIWLGMLYVDVLTAECIIDEIMFGIKKKILIFSTAPWFGARLVMLLKGLN